MKSIGTILNDALASATSPLVLVLVAAAAVISRLWPDIQNLVLGEGLTGPEGLLVTAPLLKLAGAGGLLAARTKLTLGIVGRVKSIAGEIVDTKFQGLGALARKEQIDEYFEKMHPVVSSYLRGKEDWLSLGSLSAGFTLDMIILLWSPAVPVWWSVYIVGALAGLAFALSLLFFPRWHKSARVLAESQV